MIFKRSSHCSVVFFNRFTTKGKNITTTNTLYNILLMASWSSGNAFASGAEGLRFKSWAGQIGHSVANGSPPLQHFFERSCVARTHNDVEMGPANSLHVSA